MLKSNLVLKYTLLGIFLVLLQVAVLNRISFFNYAIPIVYIYLILKLPVALNRNLITLCGFVLGFVIDIFCNTPGINAAATTLMAFFRGNIQSLFFVVDDFEDKVPKFSIRNTDFMKCTIVLVLLHHFVLFSLESFSYFNIQLLLIRVISSTILSSLLMFAFEGFAIREKRK